MCYYLLNFSDLEKLKTMVLQMDEAAVDATSSMCDDV